jgi:hypothetical protein
MATVPELAPTGKTLTFIDVLKHEVSRMQAAHPEREGAIARASALITMGMVTPSPDDPALGLVLSSDNQTTYHVNGACDCPAGQRGKDCKHVHGWKLYQYIQGKLDAQEPQEATSTTRPTPDTSGTSDAPTGLPEAPASVNVHLTISGRQVQLTLRDTSEERLLVRLQAVLERYPVAQASSNPQSTGKDFCHVHSVPMQRNQKQGRTWYSHKTAEGWCKGK